MSDADQWTAVVSKFEFVLHTSDRSTDDGLSGLVLVRHDQKRAVVLPPGQLTYYVLHVLFRDHLARELIRADLPHDEMIARNELSGTHRKDHYVVDECRVRPGPFVRISPRYPSARGRYAKANPAVGGSNFARCQVEAHGSVHEPAQAGDNPDAAGVTKDNVPNHAGIQRQVPLMGRQMDPRVV